MNIKLLRDNILVLPDKAVEKTDSGIVLPDYVKKRQNTGVVVTTGSKVKELKVGDRVLYGEYSGCREIVNNQEMFLMKEPDIIAIITEKKSKTVEELAPTVVEIEDLLEGWAEGNSAIPEKLGFRHKLAIGIHNFIIEKMFGRTK